MTLIRLTQPSVEPVLPDELKAHARIDYDDEDTLIAQYLLAARRRLEQRCGRSFVTQDWELRLPKFEDVTDIPKPPTSAILSVVYLDETHVENTVDDTLYALVQGGDNENSSMIWLDLDDKPTDLADRPDAARIQFSSGWAADEVPEDIRQAILFLADHLYNNRSEVMLQPTRQEIVEVPVTVQAFIAPYIVPRM